MKYDNERDRFKYGYDAGQIVDGVVKQDSETGRYILVDEDGIGYDPQEVLKLLCDQQIRITIVSLKSMEELEKLHKSVQGSLPS